MNLLSIAAMLMAMAAAQICTSSSQCTLNTMAPYCCEIPGTSSGACTMQSMCNVNPGPAGTCTKDSECTSSSTPCCYKTLGVGSCTTQIFCNAAAGSGTYRHHHRCLRLHPSVHLHLLHRRNLHVPQGPEEERGHARSQHGISPLILLSES